jgi:hypothetical protein
MSSRAVALSLFVSTLASAAAMTSGCSGDDAPAGAAADAGADAPARANRPAPPEPEAGTPKTCRELCEDAHPASVAKDEAIDSCWEAHCAAPCIDGEDPVPPDGADAGADGGGAGACASHVVTISPSCDECTTASCCAPWDACFQDPDCSALEACYEECVD